MMVDRLVGTLDKWAIRGVGVVANPVADEKARSLERVVQRRDAQIVVAVVKNKKYQTPIFV